MTETNLNWSRIPFQHRLSERTRGWWESTHIVTAHNVVEDDPDPTQFGGVAMLTRNQFAHRVANSGVDPSGLGRWCWVRFRGKAGVHLRVIVAYRPVFNPSGPTSVYNQHHRHWLSQNRPGCPRALFSDDLREALQEWIQSGDLILLGIDLNESVVTSPLRTQLSTLPLHEINYIIMAVILPLRINEGLKPLMPFLCLLLCFTHHVAIFPSDLVYRPTTESCGLMYRQTQL